jgi:hypothetical protein
LNLVLFFARNLFLFIIGLFVGNIILFDSIIPSIAAGGGGGKSSIRNFYSLLPADWYQKSLKDLTTNIKIPLPMLF